jgi:hypothetical protein
MYASLYLHGGQSQRLRARQQQLEDGMRRGCVCEIALADVDQGQRPRWKPAGWPVCLGRVGRNLEEMSCCGSPGPCAGMRNRRSSEVGLQMRGGVVLSTVSCRCQVVGGGRVERECVRYACATAVRNCRYTSTPAGVADTPAIGQGPGGAASGQGELSLSWRGGIPRLRNTRPDNESPQE